MKPGSRHTNTAKRKMSAAKAKSIARYDAERNCLMKVCHVCGEDKPCTSEHFHTRPDSPDGFRNDCKMCGRKKSDSWAKAHPGKHREYHKKWRDSNADKIAAARKKWRRNNPLAAIDSNYRRTYGITLHEYDELFEQQNGVCAICKLPEINKRLAVDHNHDTGKIRELLCSRCNRLLGLIEEDVGTLASAISYIERHNI